MSNTLPALLTVGELAKRLDVPIHRVEYLIRSRNLQPAQRAGNNRVFTESDLQYLAGIINRAAEDARRQGSTLQSA